MTTAADRAIDRLRSQGQRVTRARRALLAVVAATDDHLNADEIAERMEALAPDVHRATVYRTIDSLVSSGILTHVHLPHGAATYHLSGIDHHDDHLHLACRSCGAVVDAPHDLLDPVVTAARDELGFELDPHHVALTGLCRDCRDRPPRTAPDTV